ncbi:MAG: L-ribulose-5-phosphate 4-epimerase AraD [Acidobacteria bacterium]|nr:L-ribulose-5-phosphate 4-epimerase AraD [Acidobacteriota bacterium]
MESIETLRERAYQANLELAATGLVMGTFGNLSIVDRDAGVMVIKPSGVAYDALTPAHMVAVSLETAQPLDTRFRPSSDTPTHLELYRAFPCESVVHTHSECATALAQARRPVRCLGTTHADYFRGDVPVTRALREDEVVTDYERNTGLVIVETFRHHEHDPLEVPAVLVANHAPFTWGASAAAAIEHARVLEFLARLECRILAMGGDVPAPDEFLINKHYRRKHGASKYYGQS